MIFFKNSRHDFLIILISFIAIAILVSAGVLNGVLVLKKDLPSRIRESTQPTVPPTFQFSEATSLLGSHVLYDAYLRPGDSAQGVHVADVNSDGYDDILYFFRDVDAQDKAKLFLNNSGKSFTDVTESFGINSLIGDDIPAGAGFADFNNDGFEDLVLTFQSKKVLIAYGNGKDFSLDRAKIYHPNMGDARSITFLDFDRDGFVDMYLGSYFKDLISWTVPHWVRDTDCGLNILMKNMNGQGFEPVAPDIVAGDTNCTYTTIASDLDGDGFTDLYVPANFGVDQLYRNVDGKKFVNATREAFGYLRSRSSMGVDLADIFSEGQLSAYVSNTDVNLGLQFGMGSLWHNKSKPGHFSFEDIARDTQTDQCGHSWGARFIDPNRDGHPDLFVTNRITRTANNHWNLGFYFIVIADVLQNFSEDIFFFHTPNQFETPPPCFFLNTGKIEPWKNIVSAVGLENTKGGRSVAVFDFNNDGQEDLLVGNLYARATLWKGHYTGKNYWLGVKLRGTKSNRSAIGARVFLKTKTGVQLKELTVGGSFQASSTKSLIFGVPESEFNGEVHIQIKWPSGIEQDLALKELNRYFTIQEK